MRTPLRAARDARDSVRAHSAARAGAARRHALNIEYARRRTARRSVGRLGGGRSTAVGAGNAARRERGRAHRKIVTKGENKQGVYSCFLAIVAAQWPRAHPPCPISTRTPGRRGHRLPRCHAPRGPNPRLASRDQDGGRSRFRRRQDAVYDFALCTSIHQGIQFNRM